MSRIHEALQKAQAEAATLTRTDDLVATAVSDPLMNLMDESTAAAPQPAPRGSQPEATLTAWNPDLEKLIFLHGNEETVAGEQFRTLRSRLSGLREQQPFSTLLISSALPGEGKSFISGNLAHAMAGREGSRVLLIDGDLRWPRLHLLLGAPEGPGLGDVLLGKATPDQVLQRGATPNLCFVPGGTRTDAAAELLANGRMAGLLQYWSRQFDTVIVDSPALVPVSDGLLLADLCDAALLVIRSGVTPSDAAERACEELKRKRLLGVVLNCVSEKHAAKYYYRSYYHQAGSKRKAGVR